MQNKLIVLRWSHDYSNNENLRRQLFACNQNSVIWFGFILENWWPKCNPFLGCHVILYVETDQLIVCKHCSHVSWHLVWPSMSVFGPLVLMKFAPIAAYLLETRAQIFTLPAGVRAARRVLSLGAVPSLQLQRPLVFILMEFLSTVL